jgi:DNA-binding response OmpR family regulator
MNKKRILIIDDEVDFAKMLQTRLQVEGYEVLVAEDGIKGIQIARRDRPDLIILDVMMPGMDGHMVCDMLKKSTVTWSIPIIYLTARTSQADELLAMGKGAKYFLTKPYNPGMLLEMVRSAFLERDETTETPEKILVIDQDLSFVDELEAKLKLAGFDVFLAPTAMEGLRTAGAVKPDIILIDFTTSQSDSHASLKLMGQDDALRRIPFLILASQALIEKMDPTTANLDRFITKPVNFGALLQKLQKALGMQKT